MFRVNVRHNYLGYSATYPREDGCQRKGGSQGEDFKKTGTHFLRYREK
jgi:hypothetical protein